MHDYFGLSIGALGIFWFSGAMFKEDFPSKKNKILSMLVFLAALYIFINGFPYLFTNFSSATPTELFGFLGRILGLVGCARVFQRKF